MKINVKGEIVSNDDKEIYDLFGIESTCPSDITAIIEKANGDKLDIVIDSPGGDVIAGNTIYDAIRSYAGEVNIHIINAASAATIIACASTSEINPSGGFLIHNVSIYGASGDQNAMEDYGNYIDAMNRSISTAYQLKTGKSQAELLAMMNKGTLNLGTMLTAQEAVEQGFVDKIAESKNISFAASFGNSMLPRSVIDKTRAMLKNQKPEPQNPEPQPENKQKQVDLARAKLNLIEKTM